MPPCRARQQDGGACPREHRLQRQNRQPPESRNRRRGASTATGGGALSESLDGPGKPL